MNFDRILTKRNLTFLINFYLFHRSAVNCAAKARKFIVIEGYFESKQRSALAADQQGSVVAQYCSHCELQLFLLYCHYSL